MAREPMINRGSSKQSVVEWLLRPVITLMERRVKAIINSVVDLIPEKCPHCGGAIDFPTETQMLAKQILRSGEHAPSDAVIKTTPGASNG